MHHFYEQVMRLLIFLLKASYHLGTLYLPGKSAYFVGKSSKSVEALNFEQFVKIVTDNVSSGKIRRMVPNSCLMDVKYQGGMGELSVVQNADGFEIGL